jgi:hypothetical protein
MKCSRSGTATDEVHYLNPVFVVQDSCLPVITANYVPVKLDGHARRFKTKR